MGGAAARAVPRLTMPIFDAASLQTAVADQLRTAVLPIDATHAVVAVVTRDATGAIGVTGAIAAKVGEHWEVRAAGALDHEKHIAGGFEVKATW